MHCVVIFCAISDFLFWVIPSSLHILISWLSIYTWFDWQVHSWWLGDCRMYVVLISLVGVMKSLSWWSRINAITKYKYSIQFIFNHILWWLISQCYFLYWDLKNYATWIRTEWVIINNRDLKFGLLDYSQQLIILMRTNAIIQWIFWSFFC